MEELDLNPVTLATSFCSFDEESAELMICCPFKNILETSKLPQKPRYIFFYLIIVSFMKVYRAITFTWEGLFLLTLAGVYICSPFLTS